MDGLTDVVIYKVCVPHLVGKGLSLIAQCCLRIDVHYVLLICILQRELN